MNTKNRVANSLFVIGIIQALLGFILGVILGNTEVYGTYANYNEFSWTIFLMYTLGGIITGIIFIGFSEIIKILQDINDKIKGNNP